MTPEETALESRLAADSRELLTAIATAMLAIDLADYESASLATVRAALLSAYANNEQLQAAIADVLLPYLVAAYEIGGQMALDELGLPFVFNLTDIPTRSQLRSRAESLASADGDVSLAQTSASEIGGAFVRFRDAAAAAGGNFSVAAIGALLVDYIGNRAQVRAAAIAPNESVWASSRGAAAAFVRNGVQRLEYECEPDVEERCTTQTCTPHCGRQFSAENPPAWASLPKHPRCRCRHRAVMDEWVRPVAAWTG